MDVTLCEAQAGPGSVRLIAEFAGTITVTGQDPNGTDIVEAVGIYTAIRVEATAGATGWAMCSLLDLDVPDQRLYDVTPAPVQLDGTSGVLVRLVIPGGGVAEDTVNDARINFQLWTWTNEVNQELQAGTRTLTLGKAPTPAARNAWQRRPNRKR